MLSSNINRMPDAYDKNPASNLSMLFQLMYNIDTIAQTDFTDINASRDLQTATGDTLDRYGEMVGVARNGATDDQYRVLILNQIGKQISAGDCNSVLRLIAQMFNVDISTLKIVENGNANVSVSGLTTNVLEETGLTIYQVRDYIESMLPIGVGIEDFVLGGTFEFGASYVQDENTGFGNEEQTIGGTLGNSV